MAVQCRAWLLIGALSASAGCIFADSPPKEVAQKIGPEGGTIEAQCGTLEVAPGTFSTRVEVGLRAVDESAAPAHTEAIAPPCEVFPEAVVFEVPARLVLTHPDDMVLDDEQRARVELFRRDPFQGDWFTVSVEQESEVGNIVALIHNTGLFVPGFPVDDEGIPFEAICGLLGPPQDGANGESKMPPDTYGPLPGSDTNDNGIAWLYNWECNESNWAGAYTWVWSQAESNITDDTKQQIADDCQRLGTLVEQLLCASEGVQQALVGSAAVCRHHAWALESVLSCMDIKSTVKAGYNSEEVGHAWVEVSAGRARYVLDAFNRYYICADRD